MTGQTFSLVSFLGRATQNPQTGYRQANYHFPDGTVHTTPYFGLALLKVLQPDALVLFGTSGSMWDVLIEQLATADEEEGLRLRLIEAAAHNAVDDTLLAELTGLVERALGLPCTLKLIDYGRDTTGQAQILSTIATTVPAGRVAIDLTHGFRHLAAIGLLSAFFLKQVQNLTIDGLYYGALDMTADGQTPVVRLDGLLAIERWLDALSRFDQNGDYGVFAPLLEADGAPADKAQCLVDAAFFERTLNLQKAQQRIQTFLSVLDHPLPGTSGLFQAALQKRLAWARASSPDQYQRRLAYYYLGQSDYLRAALLGFEAVITRQCSQRALAWQDYRNGRSPAEAAFEAEIKAGDYPREQEQAYWLLKNTRNALAHGSHEAQSRLRQTLADPERLPRELRNAMQTLLG